MGHPDFLFNPSLQLFFFLQGDGELPFAGVGGIVEGIAGAVAFGGMEVEAMLEAVGKAGETGFAIDVGAEFEVELAGAHESVGDVDFDLCRIDRGAGGVGDGEISGAGANAAVEDGDGLGIGLLGRSGRRRISLRRISLGRISLPQGAAAEGQGKTQSKGEF
jgi:hypothetical protein